MLEYVKTNIVMLPNIGINSLSSFFSNNKKANLIKDLEKYAIAKNKNESLKYFTPLCFVRLYISLVEK